MNHREYNCTLNDEDPFVVNRRQVGKTLSLSFTLNSDVVRFDGVSYTRMNQEGCVMDPAPPSSSNGWVTVLVLLLIIGVATAVSVYMYRRKVVRHIPLATEAPELVIVRFLIPSEPKPQSPKSEPHSPRDEAPSVENEPPSVENEPPSVENEPQSVENEPQSVENAPETV